MFSLGKSIVLRYEPQFYSTYAAFDSARIKTRFYEAWQLDVLDRLARASLELGEIQRDLGIEESRLKEFLHAELSAGFVVEGHGSGLTQVYVPPRMPESVFDGFPAPFLSAPTTVDVFLTHACNLRCCHCFANGGEALENELGSEEWFSVIDQLERMGILELRLNGGEPFMHKDIFEILRFLKGRRFHKVIITNGTLLDDTAIDALEEAGVTPTVSLDGYNAEVHDDFRGVRGAYDSTMKALERLKKRKFFFGLNTCVHSGNIGQIEDIIELAIKMGAARIGLLGVEEVGRMAKTRKNMVSRIEYVMLSMRFLQLARKYEGQIEITQEILPGEVPLESSGIFTCSIDSDGYVYPSNPALGNPRLTVGNVREETMMKLWFSKKWIPFRQSLGKKKGLKVEPFSLSALGRPDSDRSRLSAG